jgi:hypothetical protein
VTVNPGEYPDSPNPNSLNRHALRPLISYSRQDNKRGLQLSGHLLNLLALQANVRALDRLRSSDAHSVHYPVGPLPNERSYVFGLQLWAFSRALCRRASSNSMKRC